MCSPLAILPICAVLVGIFSFILQFIVLPSDEWGHFTTRRITGIPEEKGHFGLWRLCSVKISAAGKADEEKCVHPQDAAYDLPTYASAAGAVSIVHLFLMAAFVVLASIRLLQLSRETPDLYLGTKRLCIVKVSLVLISVIMSISVSILASVGEGRFRQFNVFKGWAFWMQIMIISVDIVLLLVCAFENIQYWQIRMAEPPPRDPTDEFPETFVTPNYDLPLELREERVVYVKDASVQSQLDSNGDRFLQVPGAIYGRGNQPKTEMRDHRDGDVRFNTSGSTIINIRSHGSPHPRKKFMT